MTGSDWKRLEMTGSDEFCVNFTNNLAKKDSTYEVVYEGIITINSSRICKELS